MSGKVRLGNIIKTAKIEKCGENDLPVLSMTMHNGILLQKDRFKKSLASVDKSNYKIVKKGQLVVGFPIDEGVLYIQNIIDKGIMSPAYNVWNVDTQLVDLQFLEYSLHSPSSMKYYASHLRGTTARRRSLPTETLLALPLTIPDMENQKKVVRNLQKLNDVIELRNKQLEKLDLLVKSRFIEMFGDEFIEVTADSVCSKIVDCPHSTPQYNEDSLIYPAIRTSEIHNGKIKWSTMKYVGSKEYEKRIKRLKPLPGDIVYAREGTYGDCVILPRGFEFCLGQRTMLFRPDFSICNSEYLHTVLRSEFVKKQADKSNAGSTVPHVNVADAKQFRFPLPPIELQNQFADFVEQVDKSKLAIQQSLEKLETLKKSLMQEYFG